MQKKIQNYILFLLSVFIILLIIYIFKIKSDIRLIENKKINNINKLERNFFWDNFSLKDYKNVDFKIIKEWKKLIYNARELKSTKNLINPKNRDKEFSYLSWDNIIWNKVKFKFWDKILYKDIVILHFYDKKARVDSLFQFICSWKFLPINVISINSRFIEKI